MRLEVLNISRPCVRVLSFYSTLVRLEAHTRLAGYGSYGGFYSTLVRLEVKVTDMHENLLFTFLFHIGAIRSLSKNDINIILNPYGSCQVKFRFRVICCRPPIVQILWEVDGTMCGKGLWAIFR